MKTFISMLRGINLGAKNRIAMPALKSLYESLGLANVVTYVQSGNIVFKSAITDESQLAASIAAEITRVLSLDIPVLVRDRTCFARLVTGNPFLPQHAEDPTKLHITFLADVPSAELVTRLTLPPGCGDEFMLEERELYLFCPGGYGETKLSNSFFERKLKMVATTRNWKTVTALYEMAQR
jgi:uncharacterized protein (DUF1697 family)